MNWRHQQKMTQDVQDEQFLQEGQDYMQQQPQNDQIDPLDAFMDNLNQPNQEQSNQKGQRLDSQNQSSSPVQFSDSDSVSQRDQSKQKEEILGSQSDGQPAAQKQKKGKDVQVLKPFDFSLVDLKDFDKNFYQEHPDITDLSELQVNKLMKQMQIKVTGADAPRPIVSFGHLPFDDQLKRLIVKNQYQKPTPIQAIALPAVLSGRDVVGIAKTGSGKTLAYVWPMIIHASNQQLAEKGEGPCGIVMAPTRQLCQQIFLETKKYAKPYGLKVNCLLGGQNKHDQWKSLKSGVDILIASPGRLIQMLKKKATNLIRVTYLVLDQADKMLSLGFQQQIRSIISQTREDRQTLLFTATMQKTIRFLVNDIINSPIRINVGQEGAANQDVKQEVVIVKQIQQKYSWLSLHLRQLLGVGKVLIFANQRQTCEQVGSYIQQTMMVGSLVLHGDKNQYQRTHIMNSFKSDKSVLVATDIAARGIDVKNIKTVINFQCPKTIQPYIHRIGRAGRAGETGVAYTFLNNSDTKLAIELIKTFEHSGYPVPQQLQELGCLDEGFKRRRLSAKMGVSFAKGRDASKYLGQIIKKQRMGFSRAGLGMGDTKIEGRGSSKGSASNQHILAKQQNLDKMSVSEISALIRQRVRQQQQRQEKFGHFVLGQDKLTEDQKEATITFLRKNPPTNQQK